MVCRDVVADLENCLCGDVGRHSLGLRERLDVRTVHNLNGVCVLNACRHCDHIVIDDELVGHLNLGHFTKLTGIGENTCKSGSRRNLGADKVDTCVRSTRTSLKVTVKCAERHSL